MLAWSIASELGLGSVLEFHTRSDHQARDVLYEIDYLLRFYHAQTRDARASSSSRTSAGRRSARRSESPARRVVLIDEIDKAPRDFPNDLLDEIDRMEFHVPELGHALQGGAAADRHHHQQQRAPAARSVPAPLRVPSHRLPDRAMLQADPPRAARSPEAVGAAHRVATGFEQLRALPGLEKQPSTAELIAWTKVLSANGIDAAQLERLSLTDLPAKSALLKTDADSRRFPTRADSPAV